ncbi:sugar ABC transporter ATP-binding protein [Niveibacterium sp. SC-1]|uniref:sugar ABC transporter ATP-binding protein n=1 Tax=Niveibacterium sp. SC-1 TaxID=3135646 RepID=UPI00311ED630
MTPDSGLTEAAAAPAGVPILTLQGIDKRFPGVHALKDAHLRLFPGEVHTIMGQNGAGKSTLIKVLTGVYTCDTGEIRLGGEAIRPGSTLEAQALGISTVYQEINLCPNLSVAENIFIGRFPMAKGRIDWKRAQKEAAAALAALHIEIDVTKTLADYPVAIQQMVAIARAMLTDARILILDEPTSSLDEQEVAQLFAAMRSLKEKGVAILFVTHFLDQTYAMSDRITVMRNGEVEGEYLPRDLPRLALVSKMVGRELSEADFARKTVATAEAGARRPLFEAQGLGRRGQVQPMDIGVAAGEVLGLGGLLGSGRTETARLMFGAERADSGEIRIDGKSANLRSPRDAIAAGLAFLPEDRKTEGIVAELSVRENIVLALQARQGIFRFIPKRRQREIADRYIQALGIKTPDAEKPIGQLSGGNQQKALLARWLATDPKMLILDEPTRGIDVAAKLDIMDEVLKLCGRGMGIVFISSEMEEVMRVSHRIAVLRDRKKIQELDASEVDERGVFRAIAGESSAAPAAINAAAEQSAGAGTGKSTGASAGQNAGDSAS